MVEMVDARRSAVTTQERRDLYSGLLDAAHDDPDDSVAITEQELIGKCKLSYRTALMKKVAQGSHSLCQAICSSHSSLDMR